MSGRRWTAAEDATLAELIAEGATVPEAADELGVPRHRVQNRLTRLGRGPGRGRRPDHAKRAVLMALLGAGLTLSQAARQTGVGANPVRRMAKALERDGLVRRAGGATRAARYVPTLAWTYYAGD